MLPGAYMESVVIWLNDYIGWDPLTEVAAWFYLRIPTDLHAAAISATAAGIICSAFVLLRRRRRRTFPFPAQMIICS